MSDNHVLMPMLQILYDSPRWRRAGMCSPTAPNASAPIASIAQLAVAVLDGHVEIARLASNRCADLIKG